MYGYEELRRCLEAGTAPVANQNATAVLVDDLQAARQVRMLFAVRYDAQRCLSFRTETFEPFYPYN